MKIVVLVKEVPDTWGDRALDLSTGRIDRGAVDPVIDEIDERAIEVALREKDSRQAEVVVLTMGPQNASAVLRRGLAMGADSAVHVVDDSIKGADAGWTAALLAGAIRTIGFDLVVAGNESTDGRGGVVPGMIAEHLHVAHLISLDSVEVSSERVSGRRRDESGELRLDAPLPAVVSVSERSAEPRFPGFRGLMAAKKKPMRILSAADTSADLARLRTSIVQSVARRPDRTAGRKVIDNGNAGVELAEFLSFNHLI